MTNVPYFHISTDVTPFFSNDTYTENIIFAVATNDVYARIVECKDNETVSLYRIEYRRIDENGTRYDEHTTRYILSSAIAFVAEYLYSDLFFTEYGISNPQQSAIYYTAIEKFGLAITPIRLSAKDDRYASVKPVRLSHMVGVTAKYLYCIEGQGLVTYARSHYSFQRM